MQPETEEADRDSLTIIANDWSLRGLFLFLVEC
jgi:hypothetical protein